MTGILQNCLKVLLEPNWKKRWKEQMRKAFNKYWTR